MRLRSSPGPEPPRVMIVNDDPVQLGWLEAVTRAAGFQAEGFTSPVEAVRTLEGRRIARQEIVASDVPEPDSEALAREVVGPRGTSVPDLLVLDLHMPELDGWKVCRLVRSPEFDHLKQMPILVVSATFSGVDAEEISAELGAEAFLSLPCAPGRLQTQMDALLGRHPDAWTPGLLEVVVDDHGGGDPHGSAPGVPRFVPEERGRLPSIPGYRMFRVSSLEEAELAMERIVPEVVVLRVEGSRSGGGKGGGKEEAVLRGNAFGGDLASKAGHAGGGPSASPEVRDEGEAPAPLLAFLARTRSRVAPPIVLALRDPEAPVRAMTLLRGGADALLPASAEAAEVAEVIARARRERSLLRVEAVLEERTRELRRSERRYRAVVECIPDPVIIVDAAGRMVDGNRAVRTLFGPGLERGDPVSTLLAPSSVAAFERWLAELADGGMTGDHACNVTAEGVLRHLEIRGAPFERLRGEGGAAGSHLLLLVRDVTERHREAEERLAFQRRAEHAQRLESLGVMAGGVAHDFNNLLVAMLGYAALAREEAEDGGELAHFLGQIEVAARRASDLTHQILTFSGKAAATREIVDLGAVVHEMRELLAPALPSRAQLTLALPDEPLPVLGDVAQLRQVVMNLVLNAAESLEGSGGRVRVLARGVPAERAPSTDRLRVSELPDGDLVLLEVHDEGSGMPPEVVDRIFEPFFTTKERGRGLGLAALVGIVRGHRGGIEVMSDPGEGTVFRLYLPRAEARREEGEGTMPAVRQVRGRGNILVVDDEDAVRHFASMVLRRSGYECLEAEDGITALDLLEGSDGAGIEAVLLDLSMPRLDGFETLQALRASGSRVPVILTSGHPPTRYMEPVLRMASAFLPKPYGPSELVARVGEVLSGAAESVG